MGTKHLSKLLCAPTATGQTRAPMLTTLTSRGDLSSDLCFRGQSTVYSFLYPSPPLSTVKPPGEPPGTTQLTACPYPLSSPLQLPALAALLPAGPDSLHCPSFGPSPMLSSQPPRPFVTLSLSPLTHLSSDVGSFWKPPDSPSWAVATLRCSHSTQCRPLRFPHCLPD